jgi:hypothetical protein
MTASERLKELAEMRGQVDGTRASEILYEALPEIIAVAKATELCREHSMPGTRLRYAGSWIPVDPQKFLDLGAALAALDAKLAQL